MEKNNYVLYKHTFPNGKIYIGITKREPEVRYGNNGYHYKRNAKMWEDIQKYGWDNIKHEILYSGKSREEISELERQEIKKYKSNNSDFGYNIQIGGVYGKSSLYDEEEVLSLYKQGKTLKEISKNINCCARTASEIIHKYFPEDKNELINRASKERQGKYLIPLEIREKTKELFEEGYSLTLISEKAGVGKCFLTKFFKDLGYSHDEIINNISSIKLEEKDNIKKLILEGKTIGDIAKIYHCANPTISSYIKKNLAELVSYIKKNKGERITACCSIPVIQYSLTNDYIKTFPSFSEALKTLGKRKNDSHMISCCKGTRGEAYGFKWRYIDEVKNSGINTFLTLPKEEQFYVLGYFLRGIAFLPQTNNSYNLRYHLQKKEDCKHLKKIGEMLSLYMEDNLKKENCFLLKGITRETKESILSSVYDYDFIEKEINKNEKLYQSYLLGVYDSCAELSFTKISDAGIRFYFFDKEKASFIQKILNNFIGKEKANQIQELKNSKGKFRYICQWKGGKITFSVLEAIYKEKITFCSERKYKKYLSLKTLIPRR